MDRYIECKTSQIVLQRRIDTSSTLPLPRLQSILSRVVPEARAAAALTRIHCLSIRSFSCLLALLLLSAHDNTSIFARTPNLCLVVIDDLSTPILATYPPGYEDDRSKAGRKDFGNADSSAIKRTNILRELANRLASLAAKRNVAVLSRSAAAKHRFWS